MQRGVGERVDPPGCRLLHGSRIRATGHGVQLHGTRHRIKANANERTKRNQTETKVNAQSNGHNNSRASSHPTSRASNEAKRTKQKKKKRFLSFTSDSTKRAQLHEEPLECGRVLSLSNDLERRPRSAEMKQISVRL